MSVRAGDGIDVPSASLGTSTHPPVPRAMTTSHEASSTSSIACPISATPVIIDLRSGYARRDFCAAGQILMLARVEGRIVGVTVCAADTFSDLLRVEWNFIPVYVGLSAMEERPGGDVFARFEAYVPERHLPWKSEFEMRAADEAAAWPHGIHDPFERAVPTCPPGTLPDAMDIVDGRDSMGVDGELCGELPLGTVRRVAESRRCPTDIKREAVYMLSELLRGEATVLVQGTVFLDARCAVMRSGR